MNWTAINSPFKQLCHCFLLFGVIHTVFLRVKSLWSLIPCPWAQAVLPAVWHTQTHTQPETDSQSQAERPPLSVHTSMRSERERESERIYLMIFLLMHRHITRHTHTQSLTFCGCCKWITVNAAGNANCRKLLEQKERVWEKESWRDTEGLRKREASQGRTVLLSTHVHTIGSL